MTRNLNYTKLNSYKKDIYFKIEQIINILSIIKNIPNTFKIEKITRTTLTENQILENDFFKFHKGMENKGISAFNIYFNNWEKLIFIKDPRDKI